MKTKINWLNHNISVKYLIGGIFVYLSTIPWFGLPSLDSQPWPILAAFFFATVCLIQSNKSFKIPVSFFRISVIVIIGLIIAIFYSIATGTFKSDFLLIRGIANYLSLIIYLVSFYLFIQKYGIPLNIIIISNIVWLLVGITQLFYPEIVSMFVAHRTTLNRGVTSLAPEPTYFGIYLFFNSWLCLLAVNYKPSNRLKVLIFCNSIAILFLAQSLMVSTFMLVAGFVYFCWKLGNKKLMRSIAYLFTISALILSLAFAIKNVLPNSRIVNSYKKLARISLITIAIEDVSINNRLADAYFPFVGFSHNYGLPGGFHSYDSASKKARPVNAVFFEDSNLGRNRIMSWLGALVYELGLFGLLTWVFILKILKDGSKRRMFELILLTVLLVSAIPLAFPLIPFIIVVLYKKKTIK